MDKDVKELYSITMGLLIDREAKNKMFLTNEEFKNKYGKVCIISALKDKIENKVK